MTESYYKIWEIQEKKDFLTKNKITLDYFNKSDTDDNNFNKLSNSFIIPENLKENNFDSEKNNIQSIDDGELIDKESNNKLFYFPNVTQVNFFLMSKEFLFFIFFLSF